MAEKETVNRNLASQKVLIVEDNLLNQLLLETFLAEENFHLLSAHNGKEAVDIIKNDTTINLVLLDINMPVMNGYDAIKQINEDIAVIAQTGYSMDADIEHIKEAGFEGYLIKPIDQKQLIEMLHKYSG